MDYYNLVKYELQLADKRRMERIKKGCFTTLSQLSAEYCISKEPLSLSEAKGKAFAPIRIGEVWSRESFDCGWFRFSGTVPEDIDLEKLVVILDIGGEGLVYDGLENPKYGITDKTAFTVRTYAEKGKSVIPLSAIVDKRGEFSFFVDASNNREPNSKRKEAVFKRGEFALIDETCVDYFYDYTTLSMNNTYRFLFGREKLAVSERLRKSYRHFLKGEGAKALSVTGDALKIGNPAPYIAYCVGHAHLDLAYKWPIRETRRKAIRTFTNQLNLFPTYPDYVFLASQPQQYEWVRQDAPELFSRINKAVEKGNIEPQGVFWVECDANIPSGEAFIRQILLGQQYWKETFGREACVAFLPDTFGFNGNLPQILKKSGVDYFCSQKISWNDTNDFPYKSFYWEGIDGSTVLAHFPPENSYSGEATVFANNGALHSYTEKNLSDCYAMLFGVGDGGGGASTGHLKTLERQRSLNKTPQIKLSTLQDFFEHLALAKEYPLFKGELYLEKCRGTYTTQALCKYYNRKAEFALHNVEYLLSVLGLQNSDFGSLKSIWKEILLYQFHDILAGSSVSRVYVECYERYEKLLSVLKNEETSLLSGLSEKRDLLSAVNLNGIAYEGTVCHEGTAYYASLPAYGASALLPLNGLMTADENSLENDYLRVGLSKGIITSLYLKSAKKEFCGRCLNRLVIFDDNGDAWDFERNHYKGKPTVLIPISSECFSNLSEVGVCNSYCYNLSTIKEKISLKKGGNVLEIELEIDWKERHKTLRSEFRPTVFSEYVTCDIQFGKIRRSTTEKNSITKAQSEICAHKWVDVSEKKGGFSVISCDKYGYRVKNGLISMALLRSPTAPADDADIGLHYTKYALYPHTGGWEDSELDSLAYFLNNPPLISPFALNIPSLFILESASPENGDKRKDGKIGKENNEKMNLTGVIIETVKPAEDGNGTIIRLYESRGLGAETVLVSKSGRLILTDNLERPLEKLSSPTRLFFTPYEIKTFLI